ncbi:hypothetical protein BDV40DRAFT_280853 [Aspergillus tamarii]|uniref:Uncharacterized protein n=1 Tax=Aspergillus tamarii TaxID=41984 RepID=A0A5N6UE90_ASPTM|nr:hypothetical protein BDV40DRAFT_280853 [Aspergillus tamarii]
MECETYLAPLSSCNIVDRYSSTRDSMLLMLSVWITQNLMCMTPPLLIISRSILVKRLKGQM